MLSVAPVRARRKPFRGEWQVHDISQVEFRVLAEAGFVVRRRYQKLAGVQRLQVLRRTVCNINIHNAVIETFHTGYKSRALLRPLF